MIGREEADGRVLTQEADAPQRIHDGGRCAPVQRLLDHVRTRHVGKLGAIERFMVARDGRTVRHGSTFRQTRARVSWSSVCPPNSRQNCFGRVSPAITCVNA